MLNLNQQGLAISSMVVECHHRSCIAGWYTDPKTHEPIKRNVPEMLCLIHSEVSEALEGYRKKIPDTHLTHRSMIEVELADVLVRVFDLAGYLDLDIGGAYIEKLKYNETREDHKLETRAQNGGKSF